VTKKKTIHTRATTFTASVELIEAYRHEPLDLIANEVDLHACETMVEKNEQRRLLFQLDLVVLRIQKTQLHDPVEEGLKVLGRSLKRCPGRNPFAELFVDHHDDGQDVRLRARHGTEVGPQVVLHVLK